MKQYLDFLRHVREHGTFKADRTGTGTYSVFGYQMRFDLGEGFPLVTTKKMFLQGAIDELIWFISGSTNANDLPERSRHWWSPWQRADGELGPIYGEQYRRSRWWFSVQPKIYEPVPFPDPVIPDQFARNQPSHIRMLKEVWRDMRRRCNDESSSTYSSYGGVGVHIDPVWHDFGVFATDAMSLPNWELKLTFPDKYTLDKDIRCASNRYSRDTCMWASHEEQGWNTSTNKPFYATSPNGDRVLFPSIGEACRKDGLNLSAVHRCLNGELRTHHGWSNFEYIEGGEGSVVRFRELDQLCRVIASLKVSPGSRRHVINLWNSPAMEHAELPCCHGSVIQFYVAEGKLSCQIYQRSADILIGVPVNIASYALLTMMVAQVCDLAPGEFIWTGGDCHLYANHLEQADLQLSREPLPLPTLRLNPAVKDLFAFRYEDFELLNYQAHPHIKAPVAV